MEKPTIKPQFFYLGSAFLAYLFMMTNYFLVIVMTDLMPAGNTEFRIAIVPFQFVGMILGVFFSSLFLSNPWNKKSLPQSIAFITLMILPNLVLRSMGVELYTGSMPVFIAITMLTGMLVPLCNGFLLMVFLRTPFGGSVNRTGRYSVFSFTLAIAAALLIRHCIGYLAAYTDAYGNPLLSISLVYSIIRWLMAGIGISAIACVILLDKADGTPAFNERQLEQELDRGTDWLLILALIGIMVINRTLNSIMGMRLLSTFYYSHWEKQNYMLVPAGILILGFLAGFSIRSFMRIFLPAAVLVFILLPCITLFNDSTGLILLLNTLLAVINQLQWALFPVAVIELYRPRGPKNPAGAAGLNGFCFYLLASVAHLVNVFLFLGPMANRHIPAGNEYTIWIIGMAALLLIVLVFRVLVSGYKTMALPYNIASNAAPHVDSLEDIFLEHELSKREAEVAGLILREGLGTREIAKRLFIASNTVNSHIKKIFQKFEVNSRAELMAKFVSVRQKPT